MTTTQHVRTTTTRDRPHPQETDPRDPDRRGADSRGADPRGADPRSIDELISRLEPLRDQLVGHPLYARVDDMESLRLFAASHVYAVWDFMSLLKSLQRSLTCTEVPWVPPLDSDTARLINEIVLGEESDEVSGGPMSHFELYRKAMEELGASTASVDQFVTALRSGANIGEALQTAAAPRPALRFVEKTFAIIETGSTPAIAAAFAFGREDVIPDMFERLITTLDRDHPGAFGGLREYLVRHIELDGDEHGPAAENMISLLCGTDPERWAAAHVGAVSALTARIEFWDDIVALLDGTPASDGQVIDLSNAQPDVDLRSER